MMRKSRLKKYERMSPFELKNTLIDMASKGNVLDAGVLNAGRGNPNFLNTTVREAFCVLGLFSASHVQSDTPDLGFRPEKKGMAKELAKFLRGRKDKGAVFLRRAVSYAEKELKLDADSFVFELVDAFLGDYYPSPPRMLKNAEKVVNVYLKRVLSAGKRPAPGSFDLFATEGATAAMVYVFKSLQENFVLNKRDHIAILTPIFSPYLEIPALRDYNLVQVHVEGSEELGWQIPDSELKKLHDKKVKAFFMVHPTNPTSVRLKHETLARIARLIKSKRKDLIVLTDTVYATFVDGFRSFVEVVPENTICVYSYSKFFGVTGWRLGVIMLRDKNVIDALIAKLPESKKKILDRRYQMTSIDPRGIKFVDRLEMDSRDVALAHTGGLSCPQQCIMCLFSLFYLMDSDLRYKKSICALLKKRVSLLYKNLGAPVPEGEEHTYYYALIDIARVAEHKFGSSFAKWLAKGFVMDEFLFRLAKKHSTVCLPGEGFAGPKWSLRVSLANLPTEDYMNVGKNISEVLDYYHGLWSD